MPLLAGAACGETNRKLLLIQKIRALKKQQTLSNNGLE